MRWAGASLETRTPVRLLCVPHTPNNRISPHTYTLPFGPLPACAPHTVHHHTPSTFPDPPRLPPGLLGYFRPSRPITRSELEQRGVWDVERLTKPHVTEALLRQLFGERAEAVAASYMLEDGPGKYK